MRSEAKTAFVTGGSCGIGRAIAERLIAESARDFFTDIDKGTAGVDILCASTAQNYMQADEACEDDWQKLAKTLTGEI